MYRIQVLMKIPNAPTSPYAWCDVKPDGAPFEYENEQDALHVAQRYYGTLQHRVAVDNSQLSVDNSERTLHKR